MKHVATILTVILLSASVGLGSPSARHGSAWADLFTAFAPLVVLYGEYFQHSFQGHQVVIPPRVETSCDCMGRLAAEIHLGIMAQTPSQTLRTWTSLPRLRGELAAFCHDHDDSLRSLVESGAPDAQRLRAAAQQGLFADIRQLQRTLQDAFEAVAEGMDGEESAWRFGAAFALRSLLSQDRLERVPEDLRAILLGGDESEQPPGFLPAETREMINDLLAWVGVPLDGSRSDAVRQLAVRLYDAVMEED